MQMAVAPARFVPTPEAKLVFIVHQPASVWMAMFELDASRPVLAQTLRRKQRRFAFAALTLLPTLSCHENWTACANGTATQIRAP